MTAFNLNTYYHYKNHFFTPEPDPELQKQAAKLSPEMVAQIFQYRFPDALEKLQAVETMLNSKDPGDTLSHQELIDYNDALDEFRLITRYSKTGLSEQAKTRLLGRALQLNHPRTYKELTNDVFRARTDKTGGEFGRAIHGKDKQGFNLLSKAILTRHWGEAHKLLDKNADVTSVDASGLSPIDWASLMGHPKLVKRMLGMAGNRLMTPEIVGLKALSQDEDNGISDKNRQKLAQIADKGELSDKDGQTLRTIATESNDPLTLNLIADRASKNALVLQAEAQQRTKDRAGMRLAPMYFNFQDIDLEDADENNGEIEIENVFKRGMAGLAAGRNMHPVKQYRSTHPLSDFGALLQSASEDAHPRIIQGAHAVIQSGVDVNKHANYMNLPIRLNRNPKILDALLDAGANPNKLPYKNADPILFSEMARYPQNARRLIEAGVDVNALNSEGLSPLVKAAGEEYPDLALMLLKGGADPNMGTLINGNKALHIVARRNHAGLTQAMLDKGAEIDVKNKFDVTPLVDAASLGKSKSVKVLVQNKADASIRNAKGFTAEELAKKYWRKAVLKMASQSTKPEGIRAKDLRQVLAYDNTLEALSKSRAE